jgi:hypothetical protein
VHAVREEQVMRIYDEPVDVRRGLVGGQEAPEQFIWRDKLWVVTAVVSHWVETGAWWEQAGVAELLGVASPTSRSGWASTIRRTKRPAAPLGADLLAERELWRVEAARGRLARFVGPHAAGVFDLCFDWAAGQWTLARTVD